jgi:hypothetical protein
VADRPIDRHANICSRPENDTVAIEEQRVIWPRVLCFSAPNARQRLRIGDRRLGREAGSAGLETSNVIDVRENDPLTRGERRRQGESENEARLFSRDGATPAGLY